MFTLTRSVILIGTLLLTAIGGARGDQRPLQPAVHNAGPFDADFDAFVDRVLKQLYVPGFSIAVVDGGKVHSKGYGHATLPDNEATADTQYFTGSTTKAFTAAAAALLVEDDEAHPDVQWNSPINAFIREDFVLEDEYLTSHTTVEDALSHRTGLPGHDLMYGQADDTVSSIVQRMRWLSMTAQPRTTWQYCNLMFAVITDVLESITGKALEDLLRDKFWKPLGMLSTSFTIPSDTSRLATGYYWDPNGSGGHESVRKGRYVPEPYLDIFPISGAGATISTVNDYALWIEAWLNAATVPDKYANKSSPITKSFFTALATPRTIIQGFNDVTDPFAFATPITYALGWMTLKVLGQPVITHDGGLTGFGTCLYLFPGLDYGVVTMGNTAGTSNHAGSMVASLLLVQRLGLSGANITEVTDTLLSASQASLLPSAAKAHTQLRARPRSLLHTSSLPLPGSLADFAGIYTHPAYGTLNFTLTTDPAISSESNNKEVLTALFYPRTWPLKVQLSHVTDTVFAVSLFTPHGRGDIVSGENVVWELTESDYVAIFKFGLDGEVVETMGIELENTMVKVARDKGPKAWKEGMLWFEKV
ncbi:hypothetical protein LTR56_002380 [Elasticomyces elasticus]|nr:hypothetical protein LTR56_002380 [Elasticomyces elasticus]KAK3665944.1 hypothetical protein LTR22_003263 [Elasticomyces elasticus]KAK4929416.1 hypothetical protein LTR49_004020 [Elasticomyces elasticus]KAK5764705.1 hypothetical protein LTS12_005206 [Elasticomyces elasticus]